MVAHGGTLPQPSRVAPLLPAPCSSKLSHLRGPALSPSLRPAAGLSPTAAPCCSSRHPLLPISQHASLTSAQFSANQLLHPRPSHHHSSLGTHHHSPGPLLSSLCLPIPHHTISPRSSFKDINQTKSLLYELRSPHGACQPCMTQLPPTAACPLAQFAADTLRAGASALFTPAPQGLTAAGTTRCSLIVASW